MFNGDAMRRKDLDPLIFRWKKTTRALKIHEQSYGKRITDILERCTDADLVLFSDPVEAAAFSACLTLAGNRVNCRVSLPALPYRGSPAPAG